MTTVVTRHLVNTNRREGERTQTLHSDTQTQSQKVIGFKDKKYTQKDNNKTQTECASHIYVALGYSDTKPKSNWIGRQK